MIHQNRSPLRIDSRLEPFADRFLVDSLKETRLQLHHPQYAGVALRFDAPWDGEFAGTIAVLFDGEAYRMYYRGKPQVGADGSDNEVICYAESLDGIHWEKPQLNLFEVSGATTNNVILVPSVSTCRYFSPFIDSRPEVPEGEKYKAITGVHGTGLHALSSADGIHWKRMQDEPILVSSAFAFDSQNVAFWSQSENRYLLYFRTWKPDPAAPGLGYRWVSHATSEDFRHWSAPIEMAMESETGETPLEHIYTNQTHPYFRAPHLYISLAARFQDGKQVLSNEQASELGISPHYFGDCSETILMTSRGGDRYDRTFLESFIRPGIGARNWVSRANYASLGIVPTSPTEMSLYVTREYAQASAHIARYTLRTDGFASVSAPYSGGEMLTRPLIFNGKTLALNFSTSAAGSIRVELQDAQGKTFPSHALSDAVELVGDEISRHVAWKGGADIGRLAGQPVRLRFAMKDADLYSIQFA